MTTFLFNLLLTAGGDRMAQVDPHGWTLTLVSVSVVFTALIILYFVYTLSGNFFQGKLDIKKKEKPARKPVAGSEAEIAAAIAMALEAEMGNETEVAIATALHLYLSQAVHDVEPGFITIRRKESAWDNKQLNFRKSPLR